jgi:hypothetical protein
MDEMQVAMSPCIENTDQKTRNTIGKHPTEVKNTSNQEEIEISAKKTNIFGCTNL